MPEIDRKPFFDHLERLRDVWSDEIPEEIVRYGMFKVRKNWWFALATTLDAMEEVGLLEQDLKTEIAIFFTKYSGDFGRSGHLTQPEHIQEANQLITRVLDNQ